MAYYISGTQTDNFLIFLISKNEFVSICHDPNYNEAKIVIISLITLDRHFSLLYI